MEFTQKHAEEILGPCGFDRFIKFDEHGVWPKVERDLTMKAETELLRWRPARAYRELGAPEVDSVPMLPFPFTARHLAAFMLNGVGNLVADYYGQLGNEPYPESLNEIDPDSDARAAVIQAFAAYREAENIVGAPPLTLYEEADKLRRKYRIVNITANKKFGVGVARFMNNDDDAKLIEKRKMAVEATADIAARLDAANGAARVASERWLNTMVRELLQPAQSKSAPVEATISDDKKWTPKKLAELQAFRDVHRMKETEAHYGISGARIRKLLPSTKPKATPFAGLIHRAK